MTSSRTLHRAQASLPFGPAAPAPPRARRTDPQTSHAAAARVPEFASEHHARIHAALSKAGDATCYELADLTGLDHVAVARRMNELQLQGRVDRTQATRPGPNGRQCTVWRVRPIAEPRA